MNRLKIERLVVGQMQANCYLLVDTTAEEALVIDPGDDAQYIIGKLLEYRVSPIAILGTHGHFDHIIAASELQVSFGIPFLIHEDDRFLVSRMQETAKHFLGYAVPEPPPIISRSLNERDRVSLGTHDLEVFHTPGHTPGSVCYYLREEHVLFTGDLLFADGGVGRTDFSYSDPKMLEASISRVFSLPTDTELLPGHGEATSIGREHP
ncbi:MAG: MBL fold metallo-hydrolase [bacterium]|nr:MBL fold metallo-hydrolase [bacterium]